MSCSIFKLFISLYLLTEHLTWSGGRNMKNWKNFDIFQTSIFSPSPQEPRGKRRLEFTAWTDWCWTAGPSLTSHPAAPTLTRSSAGTSPSSPAGPPPSTAGSSTSATGRSVKLGRMVSTKSRLCHQPLLIASPKHRLSTLDIYLLGGVAPTKWLESFAGICHSENNSTNCQIFYIQNEIIFILK